MTSLAFNTAVNPFGAELKAMMGSDIAHWDVPDMSEVLAEAWEMVDHGWIDEAAFKQFTFSNPARFYTRTNPGFFKGTDGRGGGRQVAGQPGADVCSTCCSGVGPWSTEPGPCPWWPTSVSATAMIVSVGSTDEPAWRTVDVAGKGGVPRLHRRAHPLRRPAAVGPDGRPVGPPRGHDGARWELRVLHCTAHPRRRRLHPEDDGCGRRDPPRGPRGRWGLGLDRRSGSTSTGSTSAWPSTPASWPATRPSGGW